MRLILSARPFVLRRLESGDVAAGAAAREPLRGEHRARRRRARRRHRRLFGRAAFGEARLHGRPARGALRRLRRFGAQRRTDDFRPGGEPKGARRRSRPRRRAALVRPVDRGARSHAVADPRIRHRLRLSPQSRARRRSNRGMSRNCDDWARELHEEYGYPSARLLNRDELQAHVRSERYLGGLIDSRSGHLHPLKFTQGVARAAEAAGARIFENSAGAALRGWPRGRACTRRKARVRCAHLVLCGNAYIGARRTGAVAAHSRRRHLHHRHASRLGEERARALLPSNAAIADINWILDYFRRSADHRLLFGGRVSYSAVQPPRLAESMRRRMVRVFPDARRCQSRVCLGRLSGHHHEPRTGLRTPGAQCVLPAGLLGSRHVARPASRANWWPKRSPARRSASMCSRAFRIAIFPAGRCCGGRR